MWGHRNLPWVISLCLHNGEPSQLYIHSRPVYDAKSTLFWWISTCYPVVVMVARIYFLRETSSYKGPMLYARSINPSERANLSVPCILQLCPTSSFNSSSLNGMKSPWGQKDIPPSPDTLPQPYFSFPVPWNSLSNQPESISRNCMRPLSRVCATGHISRPRNGPGETEGGSVGGTWTLEVEGPAAVWEATHIAIWSQNVKRRAWTWDQGQCVEH